MIYQPATTTTTNTAVEDFIFWHRRVRALTEELMYAEERCMSADYAMNRNSWQQWARERRELLIVAHMCLADCEALIRGDQS